MLFQTITDLHRDCEVVRRRRYGVIEMVDGQLRAIRFRPFPKRISLPEVWWESYWIHQRSHGDRCLLFFNQPLRCPKFLAAPYAVSSGGARLRTIRGALETLGEIARIKGVDAMVCEVSSQRISERLLNRWGWERHLPQSTRRHYIKRFYGHYHYSKWSVAGSQSAIRSY